MNTPKARQLSLFSTSELYLKSSFNEVSKLYLNNNTNTGKCQENQEQNALHTTNVKIHSTSTLNQNKQQPIGNFINEDLAQQRLPKPVEFQELQFMGCSSLMDTNKDRKNDFPLLFSTEIATPLEIMGIMPELMESDRSYIEISGNITKEKYQETTTFITSTEINRITESKTSNVFSKQNIPDNIKSVEKEELEKVKHRTTPEQLEDWTQGKSIHQQDKQVQQSKEAKVLSDKLLKKEQNQQELIGNTFECLKCSTFSQGLEVQASQETDWELKLPNLSKLTPTHNCLSFPTLTSNECSTSRPAGQTKCEKWFKDNGLIKSGYQLGTKAIALMMGFPSGWFEGLTEQYSKNLTTPNQVKPQAESVADILQEEQLHQHKHRSPSEEFSISIPCLVKQPDRPELRGVIQKDLGDRFVVYVSDSDSTVTVSKLFVYPDFDRSDEQIDEVLQGGLNKCSSKITVNSHKKVSDTSAKCSSKNNHPPCTKTNKQRRQKGEGSGHIYYRTVTRNGKDYQQAYYQWRENGKQKTKYIPKKLLKNIEDAEAQKLPVTEILDLLQGGLDKCSSKSSDTFL